MGSIYKRGRVYWIKYYANGRPVRESVGTDKEKAAERLLSRDSALRRQLLRDAARRAAA